ncbi:FAR1-domain family sequence [Abeliophyllum distichum]|uniref:FAR1-domain family sequence n=1 Tax=Abeliophyllum distichum TaxID=126358 RepID=A0ABD1Q4M1_9LAMI
METENADNVFVPQVLVSRIPKIGQEFESHEEAYKFYNDYAREAGFSAHKYILQRWTKNAKVSCVGDSELAFRTDDCSSTSLMSRHGLFAHKASLIVDDAALTYARRTYLMGEFETLHLWVKDIDDGGTISWRQNKNVNCDDSIVILDPNPVRAKGCGKRLKSSKEKAIVKGNRQYCICGHVGHDKRTCPQVIERCTTDTYQRADSDYVCTEDNVVQDDGTFASNASSHHGVVEWFL